MLSFIRNLVGVKADKAVQAGVEALVRWDPQSASEAELRTMEQHLDDLGRQVATARQSFEREQKEADAIQALSHQRMVAAEQLESRSRQRPIPRAKRASSEAWRTLVTMLEQMTPGDRAGKEGRRRRQGFPRNAREDLCGGGRQAETGPVRVGTRAPRHGARRAAAASGRAAGRGRRVVQLA